MIIGGGRWNGANWQPDRTIHCGPARRDIRTSFASTRNLRVQMLALRSFQLPNSAPASPLPRCIGFEDTQIRNHGDRSSTGKARTRARSRLPSCSKSAGVLTEHIDNVTKRIIAY